jgi:hypothetical protein
MAKKSRQTFLKRAKEKARQDRRKDKDARREESKERKASLPETAGSAEDPDIAGIVPGPQPLPPQFDDPDAEEPDSLD